MAVNEYRRSTGLIAAAVVMVLGLVLILCSRSWRPRTEYDNMLAAAGRAQAAFAAVKAEKISRGLSIHNADDPNETGLIGDYLTSITTTLGDLEAKRTSVNPNAAALVVRLLYDAGVRPGDRIAVNCSASFPALNLAVLCAMDAMELEGTVFSSVGASAYGANLEEFTYSDMESVLFAEGYIRRRSDFISFGGANDQGLEFSEEVKTSIRTRLARMGYSCWEMDDLEENIQARLDCYGTVACFVNVGGNLVSTGGSTAYDGGSGLLRSGSDGQGLIGRYLDQGIPVIHLLNLKKLFPQYGLPVDPIPMPQPGEGMVYYDQTVSLPLVWMTLAAGTFVLVWAVKGTVKRMPL